MKSLICCISFKEISMALPHTICAIHASSNMYKGHSSIAI